MVPVGLSVQWKMMVIILNGICAGNLSDDVL